MTEKIVFEEVNVGDECWFHCATRIVRGIVMKKNGDTRFKENAELLVRQPSGDEWIDVSKITAFGFKDQTIGYRAVARPSSLCEFKRRADKAIRRANADREQEETMRQHRVSAVRTALLSSLDDMDCYGEVQRIATAQLGDLDKLALIDEFKDVHTGVLVYGCNDPDAICLELTENKQ